MRYKCNEFYTSLVLPELGTLLHFLQQNLRNFPNMPLQHGMDGLQFPRGVMRN